ncbi:MAG TPA: phosphotransferase, partial [Anaerolineales bacterium]|nr:phosphotransferase [Anaerolineales bacterium]
DFDDQLPDMPIAFDYDEVADLFQRKLFGLNSPLGFAESLTVKKLQDLKYRPSHRCVTTYEMIIGRADSLPERTIGVLEFTPEGVIPRIYTDDDRLPWLAVATDMHEMQKRFSQLPGYDQPIELLEIFPVRYKPGLHCVIRYMVQTPSGKEMFYGKSFSGNAERLMRTLTDLHQSSHENPDMPLISVPVTIWPEMEMILQSAVPGGVEFTTFAYDPSYDESVRESWMVKAGRALGVFHNNSTAPSETKTVYDDLRDLHEYTLIMAKVRADLAAKYEEVIQQIITKVDHFKEPKAVASHGAMRTDQFILQGDRLAMIDLDSYCWANPARDLGNFLAYLCWKAIRQPEHAQFVERAGRAFLEGYISVQKDIDERWLSVYQAASLLKIAGRRFRSLTYLEWPLVIHLIQAAHAAITEDLANLEEGTIADIQGTLVAHLRTAGSKTKFPRVFEDKPFPALWSALNAEIMNVDLTPILRDAVCSDTSSRIVHRAKLLAYKPGKRGVIRYDLDQIECQKYFSVYGKLYPEPYLSERAYKVLKTLSDEVFCDSPELGVPKPLGVLPNLSMLVFIPAEGKLLGDYIAKRSLGGDEVIHAMELTGQWLAQLHTHQISLEKEFKVENEVDNIREWAELISKKYPDEREAANHIADYLVQKTTELDFSVHVPIHKDFHYEHILIDGGLKVFDFDEMRLGDPNFDLAHFCANFYLLAYRNQEHTTRFTNLQNRFLDAYSSGTGWQWDEKFLFFYIYSCLKIAKQLCKLRGPRPWPEGDEQQAQVWLMIEQGLTILESAKTRSSQKETGVPVYEFAEIKEASRWVKASQISKSATSSAAIRVSHRPLF